jgi:hypothetical protein
MAVMLLTIVSSLSRSQSVELPAGPAQEKVRTACTECHDAHIIRQQRLSGKAWTKEVDKMIKWGAVVDPADRNAFIDYLSINFPADKAAEPAGRSGSGRKR